ncbi:MAG: MotA/TolQ/ExbB proton channel family protein [Solirubrobacteraceae bacterium]
MSNTKKIKKNKESFITKNIGWLVPLACIIAGELIYYFILGNPAGFQDPINKKGPLNGLARMYEGGFVVPILMGLFLMVVVFSVERYLTIKIALGKSNNNDFVHDIQEYLENKDVDGAINHCNKQKGSVANVMISGLNTYKAMINNMELDKEQKLANIQKELEEATALELPMLQKNLVFLSTITSLSVLVALFGTVLGMIRSFAALGDAGGGAGASELAVGISEALYNTAVGIAAGAFALVMYNVFTTYIDEISQKIDESGFSLLQNFSSLHK